MASAMVAPSATIMPTMPNALPALAVSCLDSPASARMNSRAATRYAACAAMLTIITNPSMSCAECLESPSALAEHAQHAAGDREAAEDVDAGQQDRYARRGRHRSVAVPDLQ